MIEWISTYIGKSRLRKLIFISPVLLGLLLAVIWGSFRWWGTSPPPMTRSHTATPGQQVIVTLPYRTPTPTPTSTPTHVPQWTPIFDDEFSGTDLDTTKWNVEDYSGDGYRNCCLDYGVQYFTPQALSFSQGSLRITTQAQQVGKYSYTSGAITTEDKFSFTYGRVDIRARLPKTQALWPAFWLLPVHSGGSAAFEIDIMELLGQKPTTVHMVNHWGSQQDLQDFSGPDFSQDYHVFSIIWTAQAISWYVDGIQRFESEQGISNQSMYLIINSSLGGGWPGPPNSSTVLPQYMDVKYVRVYQQQ